MAITEDASASGLCDVLTNLFEPHVAAAVLGDAAATPANRERKRQRGRACVAQAMQQLGMPVDVPTGAEGEPLWSNGFVGSISHTSQLSVAVVARTSDAQGLGVDVELAEPTSPAFAARTCSAAELERIRELGSEPSELALVVFSAKESLYKLQFPLTGESSGLRSVQVLLEPTSFVATFQENLGPLPRGFRLEGRWRRHARLVVTAAWLAPGSVFTGHSSKNYGLGGAVDGSYAEPRTPVKDTQHD